MTAHPRFSDFFRILDPRVNPGLYSNWSGDIVRGTPPRWASTPYRLTGVGAVLVGARWSVRSLMPAVYASTDPMTLNAELHYKGAKYGWSAASFHPQLTLGMRWELQAVVDLTSAAVVGALGLSNADLTGCDWETEQRADREALTQAIGRAAFERLAEGLIVPSARRPGGINVVFFPGHRRDGTTLRVLGAQALPPDMHGLDP